MEELKAGGLKKRKRGGAVQKRAMSLLDHIWHANLVEIQKLGDSFEPVQLFGSKYKDRISHLIQVPIQYSIECAVFHFWDEDGRKFLKHLEVIRYMVAKYGPNKKFATSEGVEYTALRFACTMAVTYPEDSMYKRGQVEEEEEDNNDMEKGGHVHILKPILEALLQVGCKVDRNVMNTAVIYALAEHIPFLVAAGGTFASSPKKQQAAQENVVKRLLSNFRALDVNGMRVQKTLQALVDVEAHKKLGLDLNSGAGEPVLHKALRFDLGGFVPLLLDLGADPFAVFNGLNGSEFLCLRVWPRIKNMQAFNLVYGCVLKARFDKEELKLIHTNLLMSSDQALEVLRVHELKLALAMSMHPRLGQRSGLQVLEKEILAMFFDFV